MSTAIQLVFSDGITTEVPDAIARKSKTISNMLDCLENTEEPIPLPEVPSATWALIEAYLRQDDGTEYLHNLPLNDLFDVLNAANFLDITTLLNAGCLRIANMIRNDSPEQLRVRFGLAPDHEFSEEEKAAVIQQYPFLAQP